MVSKRRRVVTSASRPQIFAGRSCTARRARPRAVFRCSRCFDRAGDETARSGPPTDEPTRAGFPEAEFVVARRAPVPDQPSPTGNRSQVVDAGARRSTSRKNCAGSWLRTFGTERVLRGGLRVYSTYDPDLQRAAEQTIRTRSRRSPRRRRRAEALQGSLVALDPATGDVLALVGGRDFGRAHSIARPRPDGRPARPSNRSSTLPHSSAAMPRHYAARSRCADRRLGKLAARTASTRMSSTRCAAR